MERYRSEIYSRFYGREDVTSVLSVNETYIDGVRNSTPNGVLEMKKKWYSVDKSRNLETKRAKKMNTQQHTFNAENNYTHTLTCECVCEASFRRNTISALLNRFYFCSIEK